MTKPWHEYKICIGLCNNQDKINSSFFWNFLGLFKPRQHIVIRGQASIKSASLNTIVKEAWKWKCEKVIFMDIDMEFPFDTIPKLLSRDVPIQLTLADLQSVDRSFGRDALGVFDLTRAMAKRKFPGAPGTKEVAKQFVRWKKLLF